MRASSREEAGGLMAFDGEGPSGVAELGHVLGGGDAVANHVADRQVGPVGRKGQHVIPVSADDLGGPGLPVRRTDVQAGHDRGGFRHDRALQDGGDGMLVGVDAGADESLREEVSDGGDEGELARLERLRALPGHAQSADGRRSDPQRPGQPARGLRDDGRGVRASITLFILG